MLQKIPQLTYEKASDGAFENLNRNAIQWNWFRKIEDHPSSGNTQLKWLLICTPSLAIDLQTFGHHSRRHLQCAVGWSSLCAVTWIPIGPFLICMASWSASVLVCGGPFSPSWEIGESSQGVIGITLNMGIKRKALQIYMYRDISNIVATETWGSPVQHIQLPGNITNERFSWVPVASTFIGLTSPDYKPPGPMTKALDRDGARLPKWLEREFTDWKVRGSNPTSASRLPLSKFGQPGSIPDPLVQPGSIAALVLPSGDMADRHRKSVRAERFHFISILKFILYRRNR
ncbi:hypothetical protein T265_09639 [Opisthorchis viverrini]|uniref:Uncharacterized protein n=1 Tax=Opisthorchis viverrini TaxID=6198 RepID=A0A074Z543_OPIVI|nr:hypothetical protein T265_09639 [Opisthorchis viverrini]KER22216.1 hypothetical protein T265_09639 [Opisthorchis viverrini]